MSFVVTYAQILTLVLEEGDLKFNVCARNLSPE